MDGFASVFGYAQIFPEGHLNQMQARVIRFRLPFLFFAIINLVIGLWSGLIRIGWDIPLPKIAAHHGAIMIGGFFTTLIALEKAIPLKRKFLLVIPVLSALSLTMVIDGLRDVGLSFLVLGGLGLMAIQLWYLFKYPQDKAVVLMVIGAACLVIADVLLLNKQFYPISFPWWMAFILFTIVGERLELSQFLPVPRIARICLYGFLGLFLTGLILPFHGVGKYLSAAAFILIGTWLLRYDVIRIGLRNKGLTRYSAVALLLGNIALIVEGILLFVLADTMPAYDSLVHTFFIGFGFTMVFAHGPIILPAVLGTNARPYSPILFLWLLMLHASLYLRIFSNLMMEPEWRKFSGLMTVASIVGYLATIVINLISNRKK